MRGYHYLTIVESYDVLQVVGQTDLPGRRQAVLGLVKQFAYRTVGGKTADAFKAGLRFRDDRP